MPAPDAGLMPGPDAGPDFMPTADLSLAAGEHAYGRIAIPADVTVRAAGDVVLRAGGELTIAGRLLADCSSLDLEAAGGIGITGTVDNHCSGDRTRAGGLSIRGAGGKLTIGAATKVATLSTSGDLDLSSGPPLLASSFDVLPAQRSRAPLAPVCAARAQPLRAVKAAAVRFTGAGADPDGGAVTFRWDFGDGASAAERSPAHPYAAPGTYPVVLTVTDDEGATCSAKLVVVVDALPRVPGAGPAVAIQPEALVGWAGAALAFAGPAEAPGRALSRQWSFDDGGTATGPSTSRVLAPGRHAVTLTVTDENGQASQASAAVYVSAAAPALRKPADAAACLAPGGSFVNLVYMPADADLGTDGHRTSLRVAGDLVIGSLTDLEGQPGGPGEALSGSGEVHAGAGGRGGSLEILVDGTLTVCGGALLRSGDGGDGGAATAVSEPGGSGAEAVAGAGGDAAEQLRLAATVQVVFAPGDSVPVFVRPGSGGTGGAAQATGRAGLAGCDLVPVDATGATASGGAGGKAAQLALVAGAVSGLADAWFLGGLGGAGGDATALGEDGGDAVGCRALAEGSWGGLADAAGGRGGDGVLASNAALALAPSTFLGGQGGGATATGGRGGVANAFADAGPAVATGGAAGSAFASGGDGGSGFGLPAARGGDATAVAKDGGYGLAGTSSTAPCGQDGVDTTATGGRGGRALASGGGPLAPAEASATAGSGGQALSYGGNGGACGLQCPMSGGRGGNAVGVAGAGGDARGTGAVKGGAGGDVDVHGGFGGSGASCCVTHTQGGRGGAGGNASATSGGAGAGGGAPGAIRPTSRAEKGAAGGGGFPGGKGGAAGVGTNVPNGSGAGADGFSCPP